MEQARLEVQSREGKGKGSARAIRRSGLIPGIVYGHKLPPVLVQLPMQGLRRILHSGGENVLANIDMGDEKTETVMIKEVQIDPISRQILHVDFMRVSLEERVTTRVPIVLVGTAPGVGEGGILEFLLRELRVECQVGRIPEHIEADISSLRIGDQIRVGDIKLGDGITVHDDPTTIVVTVAAPSIVKVEAEEAAVVEEEEEPETTRERRKEEEEEED